MRRVAAVLLMLGACAAPAPPPHLSFQFVPDKDGLAVQPGARRIDFGRAPDGVIAALDRELGPHRELALTGCPAGVVAQLGWGDLVLSFGPERFLGWRQEDQSAGNACASRLF